MSNVIPFVPKSGLAAHAALKEFVDWAKVQIHLYDEPDDPVQWGAESWHRWGLKNSKCSKLGKKAETIHPDFVDYVKAMLFNERAVRLRDDQYQLCALRCLEVALLEITQKGDVTAVTASVFDRACGVAQDHYNSANTVYTISTYLNRINQGLHSAGFVTKPFIWEPQMKPPRATLKTSAEAAKKKLPSDDALIALGEIFHSRPSLPLDIMTTSAVALLLSQPSRIGELVYLKKDCFFTERDTQGRKQLYILWHSEKGFGANRKLIPDSMAETCQEAVNRVTEITEEARKYAKWLEDNPENFPQHAGVPDKEMDAPLSLQEATDALLLSTESQSPNTAFKGFLAQVAASTKMSGRARKIAQELIDDYDTHRHYVNGRLAGVELNDTCEITLRTLNVLVREKYLPKHFPYTDDKRVTKWQDALFCFRTGTLAVSRKIGKVKPFGITGCNSTRIIVQLTGSQKRMPTIFERYGYSGVKVNTHAFRHLLNTGAQRAGLSQELIARWSGRVDVGQNRVYNHMSSEEKVAEVETFTP